MPWLLEEGTGSVNVNLKIPPEKVLDTYCLIIDIVNNHTGLHW